MRVAASLSILFVPLALSLVVTFGKTTGRVASPPPPERHPAPIVSGGFSVVVLVDGRPLEEYRGPRGGRRYVEAVRGAEYQLRIHNPLSVRVAVALTVDGLNTIDARRTTRSEASKWVIEPHQTITISGWQVTSARARRFYFTSEPDSYAAKLGRSFDLGVISAVFFRERYVSPRQVTPPAHNHDTNAQGARGEEHRSSSDRAASAAAAAALTARKERGDNYSSARAPYPATDDNYAATGIGRSVPHDVRRIDLNLDPRPAAEVTIRYEYYDALVRLGVFPRPHMERDVLQRRERARGFEDSRFCPEP